MAEKRTIELEIQDNSKTLKQQYKEAVVELQKVADAYGETSTQAAEAAKKAAGLKDQIEDTNDLLQSYKGEGAFIAMGKAMSSVASGFSAVEGGLGLLGVESEKLQETMLRVQSAMALAQGLEGLEDAGRAFKQLGSVAMDALKGIRTGLAATGIGLFLVALGTVVAYWDEIKEAVSGVSAEQKALNERTQKDLIAAEAKVDALNKQDNILKLQGKTERQILQYKITELDTAIKIAETNLTNAKATAKAQFETAKRNRDILVGILDFLNAPIKRILETVDKIAKFAGQDTGLSKWFETLEKAGKKQIDMFMLGDSIEEGLASIKTAEDKLVELKNTQAGYVLAIQQIDKQAHEKVINDSKKQGKEIIDLEKQIQDEKLKLVEDENAKAQMMAIAAAEERIKEVEKTTADEKQKAELIKLIRENLNNELDALDEEYYAKQNAAKAEADRLRIEQENALLDQIEQIQEQNFQNSLTEQQRELQAVNDKYFALEAAAEKNKEQLAIIEEAKGAELDAINKKYLEKQKQDQQQKVDLILKYAQTFGQAMSSLNGLLNANDEARLKNVKQGSKEEEAIKRKMFERDKKLRIVQTVIDTASNIVQSVRNGGGIPSGIPFGVAAGAMGAMQIAAISKAKFDGGQQQVPDASAGGGGQMAAPQFNTIGTSGINQLATLQQQPTKAYVVSGEVTSAQSLDRNRLQNATL
jgi:hypothetical protein